MHFKKMHLVNAYIAYFYHFVQGRIQDFLRGGSNLQRGFDLLNLPDTGNLLFFTDFSENSLCLSDPPWWPTQNHATSGSNNKLECAVDGAPSQIQTLKFLTPHHPQSHPWGMIPATE